MRLAKLSYDQLSPEQKVAWDEVAFSMSWPFSATTASLP